MWVVRVSQARAGMLQFRLSLSRQSNPSILTAGLSPKLARTQPPFLVEEEGDGGRPDGEGTTTHDDGERGEKFSSPNRASWINGLATLLGGDPLKNGGDEDTCGHDCSKSQSPCKANNNKNQQTIKPKTQTLAPQQKLKIIKLIIIKEST